MQSESAVMPVHVNCGCGAFYKRFLDILYCKTALSGVLCGTI